MGGFQRVPPLVTLCPTFLVSQKGGPPEGVVAKSALPRASAGRPRPASLLLLSPPLRWALPGPPISAGQRENMPPEGAAKKPRPSPRLFPAFQSRSARSISVTSTSSSTPFRNTVRVTVSPAENWFFTALNSSMVNTSAPSMAVIMSPAWMPWR